MTYNDLFLEPNRIRLSEMLIYKLGCYEGETFDIVYDNNSELYLVRSENGSKLCSNLTFSFKGKKHEMLSKLGTCFNLTENNKLEGDGVITEFDYSKSFEPEPLDASIILDTNYNINKLDKYIL